MTITSSDILDEFGTWLYEPTRSMGYALDLQERLFGGEEIFVDPSTPGVHLTEMNVIMSCAAIQTNEILDYRAYPNMAETEEAISYHMTDRDFVGMFTSPGGAWFDLYFELDDVVKKAVKVGNTRTRKLTIPKHSKITVNGMNFTFQYPVNFIVKSHGGVDVVYDLSRESPLQQLRGNKVEWDVIQTPLAETPEGYINYIKMRIYLKQMTLTSYEYSVTSARVLRKVLSLTDKFYYVRAFNRRNGEWVEMKTTNSQQTFSPSQPTLLYSLIDNALTIELPYVYSATGAVTDNIRVDVYTTKGPINSSFAQLRPADFQLEWKDLDKDDGGIYYAPLAVMNSITVISDDIASGGAEAPSFETRRERVKNNAMGDPVIPISDAQMGTELENLGFDSMLVNDDLAELVYLASKAMPANTEGSASTGIDSAVLTMKSSATDLLQYATVLDNGPHLTVTPKTLYRYVDGVLKVVPDAERQAIDLLVGEAKVNKINADSLLWSPLHYVLDFENNEFNTRPYYLNSPKLEISEYMASNVTLGLTIGASTIRSITPDDNGYVIDILAQSNDAWKALKDSQVHVQLGFIPEGESTYAFINGTQVAMSGGERVFRFRISTNWDISSTHHLTTTNFSMFEDLPRKFPVALDGQFTLVWAVSDYVVEGSETTTIDQDMGKWLLPTGALGVYQEGLDIVLGSELSGLWARCRPMIGTRKYATYDKDVYQTHQSNVYAEDPVTRRPIVEEYVDDEGVTRKRVKKLHNKGDVVLDAEGNPEIKHHAGTAVMDENGNPVLESARNMMYWWDMTLFDAVYRYATGSIDSAYRVSVPNIMVEWINDSLAGIKKDLLTSARILFQPRSTIKYVETRVEDSELKSLHTAQHLVVDLFVSQEVYGNAELRTVMEEATIQQVVAGLDKSTVARNVIEKAITDNLGTDIMAIHLSGLGGRGNDFNVIVLLDDTTRLCLAKSLKMQADGTFVVVDGIEVNFKLNDASRA